MMKVYNCIVTAHDLRLVVLAAIVCPLASFAAISLLHHSRERAEDDAAGVARHRRDLDRLWHLGDPLHRHAGVTRPASPAATTSR